MHICIYTTSNRKGGASSPLLPLDLAAGIAMHMDKDHILDHDAWQYERDHERSWSRSPRRILNNLYIHVCAHPVPLLQEKLASPYKLCCRVQITEPLLIPELYMPAFSVTLRQRQTKRKIFRMAQEHVPDLCFSEDEQPS